MNSSIAFLKDSSFGMTKKQKNYKLKDFKIKIGIQKDALFSLKLYFFFLKKKNSIFNYI